MRAGCWLLSPVLHSCNGRGAFFAASSILGFVVICCAIRAATSRDVRVYWREDAAKRTWVFVSGFTIWVGYSERAYNLAVPYQIPMMRDWAGFGFRKHTAQHDDGRMWSSREACAPIWAIVVILWSYPMVILVRWAGRRLHRNKNLICARCCYNLTGNISGVCPECGRPIFVDQALPGVNSTSTKSESEDTFKVDSP